MDGHATGVDGGDACRGHDGHTFDPFFSDFVQEGGFAGTCFSGEKDVFVGVTDVLESEFELRIGLEEHD